jgi:RHS repeat-associated protein
MGSRNEAYQPCRLNRPHRLLALVALAALGACVGAEQEVGLFGQTQQLVLGLDAGVDASLDEDDDIGETPTKGSASFGTAAIRTQDTSNGVGPFAIKIRTCTTAQDSGAATSDPISVTLQTAPENAQTAPKAWTIYINHANDMAAGSLDENKFWWPAPATLRDVRHLQSIRIHKRGRDPWCFSEVLLTWNHDVIFRWTASDVQPSGRYVVDHPRTGVIRLDDNPANAPASFVRFTNLVKASANDIGTVAAHQAYLLEVATCNAGALGTSNDVHIRLVHDGLVDTVVVPGSSFVPGQARTLATLNAAAYVENLDKIELLKPGNDNLCIDAIRIRRDDHGWVDPLLWQDETNRVLTSSVLRYQPDELFFNCICPLSTDTCGNTCFDKRQGFQLNTNTEHANCAAGVPPAVLDDLTCDNRDQDCSGRPDDDWRPTPPHSPSQCVGQCQATATCTAGVIQCGPSSPEVPANSVDEDCNGVVDDVPEGGPCSEDEHCAIELICVEGTCRKPSCENGIKDPGEVEIDCGGVCPECDCPDRCRPGTTLPELQSVLRLTDAGFERATRATYEVGDRVVHVSPNELRWPVIDGRRFALLEGESQNLVPWSANFADARWRSAGATRSVHINTQLAPDSTPSADELRATAGSARSRLLGIAIPSTVSYTFSTWLRSPGGSQSVRAWLLQQSATGDVPATFTATRRALWEFGSSWKRFSVADTRSTGIWVGFSEQPSWPTSDVRGMESFDLVAWGAQLEAMPFASSYIPTAGGATLRAADRLWFAAQQLPAWIQSGPWQVDVVPQFDSDQARTLPMVLFSFRSRQHIVHEVSFVRDGQQTFLQATSGNATVFRRALTFARNDVLTLTFDPGAQGQVIVAGARSGNGVQAVPNYSIPRVDLRIGGRYTSGHEAYVAMSDLRVMDTTPTICTARPECECGNGELDPGEQCDPGLEARCDRNCLSTSDPNQGGSDDDCPIGQTLVEDVGSAFGLPWSFDICMPGICPDRPDLCGGTSAPCGACECVPDCSDAACGLFMSAGDGCGGSCAGTCDIGVICLPGQCKPGLVCGRDNGPLYGAAAGSDVCWDPRCEGPNPPPVANCPPPSAEPDCGDKVCGVDENGRSCGTCSGSAKCDGGYCIVQPEGDDFTVDPVVTSGVGALPGSLSVSDLGHSKYRIPIDVLPTRGELIPNLTLEYDSSRGNGYIGTGWTVSSPVLSIISRCASNETSLHGRKPIALLPSDEMCLDGQPLVETDEKRTLPVILRDRGVSDARIDYVRSYRTRLDSHSLIFAVDRTDALNDADKVNVFDPDEWYVVDPNAHLKSYGISLEGRLAAPHPAESEAVVPHTWALQRVGTLSGDVLTVTYVCTRAQGNACVDSGQSLAPTSIAYGCSTRDGHDNCTEMGDKRWAVRQVLFRYDQEGRPDPIDGFRAGSFIQRRVRLTKIALLGFTNPGTGNHLAPEAQQEQVRTYLLTYGKVPEPFPGIGDAAGVVPNASEPARLASVQLCAGPGDTGSGCLKPTTFRYGIDDQRDPSQLGFPDAKMGGEHTVKATLTLDVDGNGTTDWLRWDEEGLCLVRSLPDDDASHGVRFDLKCDDVISGSPGASLTAREAKNLLAVQVGDCPSFANLNGNPDEEYEVPTWCDFEPAAEVGDIDGDQRDDLFVYDPTSSQFVVYTSTGSGFRYKTVPVAARSPSNVYDWSLIDINRDGRQDAFFCAQDSQSWAYRLASGLDFGPEVSLGRRFDHGGVDLSVFCARQAGRSRPFRVDVTGDGVPEVFARIEGGIIDPNAPHDGSTDGLVDLRLSAVTFVPGPNGTFRGEGLFTGMHVEMLGDPMVSKRTTDLRPIPIDVNGDGLMDLVTFEIQRGNERPAKCEDPRYECSYVARLWRNRGVRPRASGDFGWLFEDSGVLTTHVEIKDHEGAPDVASTAVKIPLQMRHREFLSDDLFPFLSSVFSMDYDGDGRGDLLFPKILVLNPDLSSGIPFLVHRGYTDGTKALDRGFSRSAQVISRSPDVLTVPPLTLGQKFVRGDFNGDRAPDLHVYAPKIKRDHVPTVHAQEWTAFGSGTRCTGQEGEPFGRCPRYLLKDVVDGLGNTTHVRYGTGIRAPYEAGSCTWPLRCASVLPHPVVERVVHLSGGLNRSFRDLRYAYQRFSVDTRTRTPIGFSSREVTEVDADEKPLSRTRITYDQRSAEIDGWEVYPFASRAGSIVVRRAVAQHGLLSVKGYIQEQSTGYFWDLWPSDEGRPFVYLDAVTRSHGVDELGQLDADTREIASQTDSVTRYDVDQYGNVVYIEQDSLDGHLFTRTLGYANTSAQLDKRLLRLHGSTIEEHRHQGQLLGSRFYFQTYYDNGLLRSANRGGINERAGHSVVYERDEEHDWQVTSITEGQERTTTVEYDDHNVFPIKIKNALGHETEVRIHPALGVPISSIEPGGVQHTWRYDLLGRLESVTGPEGTTTVELSEEGAVANENGLAVDAVLKSRVETPWGGFTETLVNSLGQTVAVSRDGLGAHSVVRELFQYDARGRLEKRARPHDGPLDGVEEYFYDGLDDLVEVEHADNTRESFRTIPVAVLREDLRGLLPTDSDWARVAVNPRGHLGVEALGRRGLLLRRSEELVDVGSTARSWLSTNYRYGKFDSPWLIVDPKGNPTELRVDAYGRLLSRTDPASGYAQFDHDGFDELKAVTDAESRSYEYDYDKLGRLISRTAWDGDHASWTYDCLPEDQAAGSCAPIEQGRLLRASTASGNTVEYDYYGTSNADEGALRGYMRSVTQTTRVPDGTPVSHSSTMRYTPRGFLRSLSYPSFQDGDLTRSFEVAYTYDGDEGGNVMEVRDAATDALYWKGEDYEHGHRFTLERLGNGVGVRTAYQANTGRVAQLLAGLGAARAGQADLVQNRAYGYDENGNVTSEGAVGSFTLTRFYEHDSLNRLRKVSFLGSLVEEYQYDDLGNVRYKQGLGDYTYDQADARRLDPDGSPVAGLYETYKPFAAREFGDAVVHHDFTGNETWRESSAGTREIRGYNAFNLPREIVLDGTRTVSLDYDAGGARVAKHDGSDHTYYFGQLYTHKVKGDGTVEHDYFVALGTRTTLQVTREEGQASQSVRYVLGDRLGSASVQTDEDGARRDETSYTAFGEHRAGTPPATDKPGYTGHLHDPELGLVNMRGRLYDPTSARFTTPDPFVFKPWGAGLNRYSYVENNPLRFIDPSGFCAKDDTDGCIEEAKGEGLPIDEVSFGDDVVTGQGPAEAEPPPEGGAPGNTGEEIMGGNEIRALNSDERVALEMSMRPEPRMPVGDYQAEMAQMAYDQPFKFGFDYTLIGVATLGIAPMYDLITQGTPEEQAQAGGEMVADYYTAGMFSLLSVAATAVGPANTPDEVRAQKQAQGVLTATVLTLGIAAVLRTKPPTASAGSWTSPKVFTNRHGQLTNGKYTLDAKGMSPHTTGSLAAGKSQFLNRINESQLVLDAASFADQAGLWVGNKAKVEFSSPVGVHAGTGELTNVVNVYRNANGFVHGAPGSPLP